MMMPLIVAIASIAALVRGGSLHNIASLQLRGIPLVIGGLILQLLIFTPFRMLPLLSIATPQLYVVSMALLVVWVALNWHIPGITLMGAGLLMNCAAIVANNGYMPVAPASVRYAERLAQYTASGLPSANNSIAIDEHVRLWLLTDIIAVPGWVPLANVFSLGDVFLTIGASLLCYQTIRRPSVAVAQAVVMPTRATQPTTSGAARPSSAALELARRLKYQLSTLTYLVERDMDAVIEMSRRAAQVRRQRDTESELSGR
jgi:hypothetical protein